MMTKPWIGFVAAALMLAGGVLEILGGNSGIGAFLILMSVLSLVLRTYFVKKLRDGNKNN